MLKWFVVLFGLVLFLAFCSVRIVAEIQFDRNCEGYLKRAADANSIELAKSQLEIALKYIEKSNLTEGYTSILWNTPDEDISFWYKNVSTAYNELVLIKSDATSLEKSNMLMKLRETLLDNGSEGKTKVTYPDGISVYPFNMFVALWGWVSTMMVSIGICTLVFFDPL